MAEKPSYEELERRVQELERIESKYKSSKEALQENESLFNLLYEKAPLGYQSLDENGHFIVVNQTWLDSLGYTREEVIGKSFVDFLHPHWRDHFKKNFPRFKSIGEVLGVEFEMVKKNGDHILVSFTGKISRDKTGAFQQTHCIFHDITELKQAEKARKASEHKFRIIADYTYDWEGWHDNKGTLLWVNPAVERMTGRTTEECLAMREYPLPIIHPEDRHVFETLKVQALAGKSGNDVPFRIVHKDHSASEIWAAVSWNPVLDDCGTPEGYRTSIRDITDRKRMQKALRESEEKYRILFEHTGEALFVAQDARIVFQNPRSTELLRLLRRRISIKTVFRFHS
jgi:two-component system, cell cycle sensor histidine kinase and response regulator CckA